MSNGLTLLPRSVPQDGFASWRCWVCGGAGAGDLPREHSSGRCMGTWWWAVGRVGDLLTRAGMWLRTAAVWHAHRRTARRRAMAPEAKGGAK